MLHPLPLIEPERICPVRNNNFPLKAETVLFRNKAIAQGGGFHLPPSALPFILDVLVDGSNCSTGNVRPFEPSLLLAIDFFFSCHLVPLPYSFSGSVRDAMTHYAPKLDDYQLISRSTNYTPMNIFMIGLLCCYFSLKNTSFLQCNLQKNSEKIFVVILILVLLLYY